MLPHHTCQGISADIKPEAAIELFFLLQIKISIPHIRTTRSWGINMAAAGVCGWCTIGTDLTDASHPGNEQLAKEFILHRHLGEEVIDFVILTSCPVFPFSDYISKDKAGFYNESTDEGTDKDIGESTTKIKQLFQSKIIN